MNSHCPSILTKTHYFLITLIGIVIFSTNAKVLPDPIIGERCEDMANRRKEKYQYKQRIYELLTKNHNLRAQTPPQKEKLIRNLYKIHNDLNQRRHLIEAQLLNLEEEIIRKGCPGLPLGELKDGQALEKMDDQSLEKMEGPTPTAENLEKNDQTIIDESSPIETPIPMTEDTAESNEVDTITSNATTNVTPDASAEEISDETLQNIQQDANLNNPDTLKTGPLPEKNDTGTTP